MDERRLAELLHDAVADTPPPSFDEHDVARASERQRIRRRNAVVTGSAFGVVVLASATALGVALWTGPNTAEQTSADTAAAGGNATASPNELPEENKESAPDADREYEPQIAPSESRKQGRPSSGESGPAGPGSTPSGCEQASREFAAALAGELPAAANVTEHDAESVQLTCPHGSVGALFHVVEDGQSGTVSFVIMQPDVTQPQWTDVPEGTQRATDDAADGRMVVVLSEPGSDGGIAPFGNEVQQMATDVAQGL